jgi:hypothetical protein
VWSASAGDVFSLVADDRSDSRFEILGRFDWPIHGRTTGERELCTIAPRTASTSARISPATAFWWLLAAPSFAHSDVTR